MFHAQEYVGTRGEKKFLVYASSAFFYDAKVAIRYFTASREIERKAFFYVRQRKFVLLGGS